MITVTKQALGGEQLLRVQEPLDLFRPDIAAAKERGHTAATPLVAVPVLADVEEPFLLQQLLRNSVRNNPVLLQVDVVLLRNSEVLRLLEPSLRAG